MAGVPVRVLIADDERSTAARTSAALDSGNGFELVGVAATAAQAGELAEESHPDVALVSSHVQGGGDETVRAILDVSPATQVLVHSGPSADSGALRGLLEHVHAASCARDARITKRARIRRVLELGELDIVFQPIVALASREVVGYEALSRFSGKPHRGPDEWFAEAHDVGLGPELELAAIRLACAHSSAIPEGMFMAVNVSPVTAEQPELLQLLGGCHVNEVVLEVTEHAQVEDYRRFRVAIARVRELGARLAVDDAGAGFSSLRHILELDAELIKLDGSLTRSLEADPRRRSLASALIEFGRESGASVLAEHIESELQLIELRRLGVHYGQGFHLGRPQRLPAAASLRAASTFQ
jgi:EAL domain-containing protein (putative c-di-GMP-specific phosphodiesterase class I)